MKFISTHKLAWIGIVIGATAGYLYYHFIGCASGTCMIISKPINSTLYGALLGFLLFSSIKKNQT